MSVSSPDDGRAVLRINLAAIRANWRLFAALPGGAKSANIETGATIKADAYGLGAARIGPALHAEGCRTFFVAQVQEGAALRAVLGGEAAIYVYNGPTEGALETIRTHDLIPVLNSPEQIALWRGSSGGGGDGGPCALHLDTGMNRLGLSPDQARALAASAHGLDLKLVMSHLACADTPDHPMNAAQLARFRELSALFPGVRRSLSGSAGALLGADYRFDLIRPGVGLYGGLPPNPAAPGLSPAATIEAPILMLRDVRAGETIGYDAAFTAPSDMRIAIAALGYADGLMRAASSGAPHGAYGLIEGARAPLIGRVSMDLCALDVTGIGAARRGARAEFLGPALADTARAAGTIPYELLTRLGQRFARVWTE